MKSLLLILTIFLIVFCFTATLFHLHEDGDTSHECPVCRLVQAITGIFVLALVAILIAALRVQKLFTVFKNRLFSLYSASPLQGRAPPVFSF